MSHDIVDPRPGSARHPRGVRDQCRRALTVLTLLFTTGCATLPQGEDSAPRTYNAELAYLRSIHEHGHVSHGALTLMLMSEFISARRTGEGVVFFERLVANAAQNPLYLACLGALRAAHADQVPLLRRIAWVDDSVDMLNTANTQVGNKDITLRWLRGTVLARLPRRFKQRQPALDDLLWVLDHTVELPEPGMLREAYFQLARLHEASDNAQEAQRFLALSGFENFERSIELSTSFAVNAETGHTFHPPVIREVVPGKVYIVSGYEFTEYYFVVTANGKELVSIDAGTRPDAARAVYEALVSQHPGLPPLTTVLVTHAHWDHVGGYKFFRTLNPGVEFVSRDNYEAELALMKLVPGYFKWFFGTRYTPDNIAGYRPDRTVSARTAIDIGGTRFELIPVDGGETRDALFVHVPEYSTTFVGDFIMPFVGAPFVPEGNPDGLFDAIDILAGLRSEHVLHGHETLTRRFGPPQTLVALKSALQWLKQETYKAHTGGAGRADIHALNLIAPVVLEQPDVQFTYLVMRENFINRVYDQMTGYWKYDLEGMDYLGDNDYGALLGGYLGLKENAVAALVRDMIDRGDYALAARVARWGRAAWPDSTETESLRRLAYLKLKEKYQFINPFKVIIYSEQSGDETPQLQLP